MAAYEAKKRGHDVTVIEKNEKCGKKIYITGKGRCNVTNGVGWQEFLDNVVQNPKFLISAIRAFPPSSLMEFLEEGGLPLKVERGNRVFPVSDKASDVTKCLERYCLKAGVVFRFNETVLELKRNERNSGCEESAFNAENQPIDQKLSDSVQTAGDGAKIERLHGTHFLIKTNIAEYVFDAVIVSTGGVSYPATGSTGDGYIFAQRLGIATTPRYSALCGLACSEKDIASLQGLSLKNVRIDAKEDGKTIKSFFGEMLFTHFGISGPIVLSLSSCINRRNLSSVQVTIDLKPALDLQTLDHRILRDFDKFKNKQIVHALVELLPKSLIEPVLRRSKIPPTQIVNSIKKEQRAALLTAIKNFTVGQVSLRPIEEGIVTSGGIKISEIDPKTMECKKMKGLYFCGEVLDVDALTGGFNLQIAFSTGYLAGRSV